MDGRGPCPVLTLLGRAVSGMETTARRHRKNGQATPARSDRRGYRRPPPGPPRDGAPRYRTRGWRLPGGWHRRFGRRPRCVSKILRRAPGRQRHGLHRGPASRSDAPEHDGRVAGWTYADDGAAGRRSDAARARLCLRHSARGLSFDPGWRAPSLQASGASRRAHAFDFLLRSLSEELGERAICIILSGTGADGSLGLKAIKEKGGLVIAQDPSEAGYDGMPRNAIATGAVDLVLPVAKIPAVLAKYSRQMYLNAARKGAAAGEQAENGLADIVALLRAKTPHDFTLYKPGTLQRRIERRMAIAAVTDSRRYFELLQQDPRELELLAKDLLINVTSFFRDPEIFEFLAKEIVPGLVRMQGSDRPLRIWVAGCSTGEETYSIAMLLLEEIAAAGRNLKLQVFASDVDEDAVAFARNGIYPETIEADVPPPLLARFFTKEDHSYRVVPALREVAVFTVQDVLADPPFSRLDLVCCRNLL